MLLHPLNLSMAEVSRREGVSEMSLSNWRKQLSSEGSAVSENKSLTENWSAETKFAVVLEAAGLSEIDLGEYCRRKGLYPEQITAWRQAFITGQKSEKALQKEERDQARKDKKRIQELERELRRKDKALAETAALLVLRKKLNDYGERPTTRPTNVSARAAVTRGLAGRSGRGGSQKNQGLSGSWSVAAHLATVDSNRRYPDRRPYDGHTANATKCADRAERQAIVTLCNSPQYAHLPPSQIVPRLADQACYLASESTFYRVLRAAGQQQHRGRSLRPRRHAAPTTHAANAPNQVWSWDITYLPSPVRGKYYYLYLIEDIYSRKAVGWEVYDVESGEKAAALLQRSVIGEQCLREPLVLHSDNGAPMKSVTLLSKMYDLGITPSRGRPRVSNDNPYSESLFRTLKYCPQWPQDGFASLDAARAWVRGLCAGTTTSTDIAASGSSHRLSGIEDWIIRSWPSDMSCTNERRKTNRSVGQVGRVTGSRLAPCC